MSPESGEQGPIPLHRLRDQSQQRASDIVDELIFTELPADARDSLTPAIVSLAHTAATSGNTDSAIAWGRRVAETTPSDSTEAIDAFLPASLEGHQWATEEIKKLLKAERLEAAVRREPVGPDKTAGFSPRLQRLVQGYARASLDAQDFIKEFSVSPSHAWRLGLDYLEAASPPATPEEQRVRNAAVIEHVNQVLPERAVTPSTGLAAIGRLLDLATDDATKDELIARFTILYFAPVTSIDKLDSLLVVGPKILATPEPDNERSRLDHSRLVKWFENRITEFITDPDIIDQYDLAELSQKNQAWQLGLMQFKELPVADQISEIKQWQMDAQESDQTELDSLIQRNRLLQKVAITWAQAGDLTAAGQAINEIKGDKYAAQAVKACVKVVLEHTSNNLDQNVFELLPSHLKNLEEASLELLDLVGDLHLHLDTAHSILKRDPMLMGNQAIHLASRPTDPDVMPLIERLVDEVFALDQNPDSLAGRQLAYDVANVLVAADAIHGGVDQTFETAMALQAKILEHGGEPSLYPQIFQLIDQKIDPFVKARQYAQLAATLAKRLPHTA